MPTAHELVARGAELLDEKLPGWADQIDVDHLYMASGCRCVLGQLAGEETNLCALGLSEPGEYWDARKGLGLGEREGFYGFNVSDYANAAEPNDFTADPLREYDVTFEDLRDAWKGEIVARRTL